MKKFFLLLIAALAVYGAVLYLRDESDLPPLKNGDLVFQTSWTDQSIAVGVATLSLYLHTGIVEMTDQGPMVIDAADRVRAIPLSGWIEGGIWQRFSVYRYKGLTEEQGLKVVEAAKTYSGQPYDFHFLFDNEAIYCSELPYLSFKSAGIDIGTVDKVESLYINNIFTKELIERRWEHHPQCQGRQLTFNQCYDIIMSQALVTPSSLANDKKFERIFTNYP